jgi:3'(2'), 5'-bisphosphate nucleotidase
MTASDASLAADLARAAGALLVTLRGSGVAAGRTLGAIGDAVANELLVRALAEQRPLDGLLSEESAADPARLECSRVWIVDPLDGTREYGEGRDDWAVHVGLCVDGAPGPAAVALPGRDALFLTDPPPDPPIARAGERPLRIAVSRTRPPIQAERLAERLKGELVPMGSAGVKTIAVLTGEVDAYVHAGGQYEWDSAAPVGVALAAGLHASRIDGSPLRYNRPDPLLPDLVVCRAELAGRLLDGLAQTGALTQ